MFTRELLQGFPYDFAFSEVELLAKFVEQLSIVCIQSDAYPARCTLLERQGGTSDSGGNVLLLALLGQSGF